MDIDINVNGYNVDLMTKYIGYPLQLDILKNNNVFHR